MTETLVRRHWVCFIWKRKNAHATSYEISKYYVDTIEGKLFIDSLDHTVY